MSSSIIHIKRRLAERAGLDPDLLDRAWFERIVERRLRELRLDNNRAYCELLDRDARELQRLVEHVSVTETWFFRYPQSFDLLLRDLKARRTSDRRPPRLKMLSVACATGQEPYSMAMAAAQAGWPLESVDLDAVDRNEDAITVASCASYPRRSLRDDAPDWASHWLRVEGDRICIDARIKAAVNWTVGDILQPLAPALQDQYEVIFCRNLLIYLRPSARAELVERLSGWLSPTGLLFVGHAERVESLRSRFRFVTEPHTFALRARESEQPAAVGLGNPDGRSTAQPVLDSGHAGAAPIQRDIDNRSTSSASAHPRSERRHTVAHDGRATSRHGNSSLPAAPKQQTTNVPTLDEASALADNGDLDGALQAVETAIQAQAPTAEAYGLLGSVHLAKGNLPMAREAFVKSLYLDAQREETLLQLALVYQRLGNRSQAARYRRRAEKAHRAGRSEKRK